MNLEDNLYNDMSLLCLLTMRCKISEGNKKWDRINLVIYLKEIGTPGVIDRFIYIICFIQMRRKKKTVESLYMRSIFSTSIYAIRNRTYLT